MFLKSYFTFKLPSIVMTLYDVIERYDVNQNTLINSSKWELKESMHIRCFEQPKIKK